MPLFVHSCSEGHLDGFQFSVTMHKAPVNINHAQVFSNNWVNRSMVTGLHDKTFSSYQAAFKVALTFCIPTRNE